MLISALLSLFLGIGGYFLLETWVEANAHEIAVPSWYNGWYDGGRFIGEFYRLPDGSDVGRFTDVRALAPAGGPPSTPDPFREDGPSMPSGETSCERIMSNGAVDRLLGEARVQVARR